MLLPEQFETLSQELREDTPTEDVVSWALRRFSYGRLVLTTAFGMEGCALIDMFARARADR